MPGLGKYRDLLIAGSLFAVAFAIFYASPNRVVTDSKYSMLLSEQLLLEQSFALDPYFWPYVDSSDYPKAERGDPLPRHVQPGGYKERLRKDPPNLPLYYIYPHGTSVLSVPIVAVTRLAGLSTIDENGRYDFLAEKEIQAAGAAFLMAVATVIFYFLARLLLPWYWSLGVALVGSLGSNVWSTASRAMWSHTWDIVLLAAALYLLLRAETDDKPLHPIGLATLFSWAFFVRPTAALFIAPLTLYVALRHRRQVLWLVVTGGFWLGLFLLYSQMHFEAWLPEYYTRPNKFELERIPVGVLSHLLAPSRGLFIFSPVMLMVVWGLTAYRKHLRHRSLLWALLAVFTVHLLMVSGGKHWFTGLYGQRFLTDLVPLFVVLGILALRAALDVRAEPRTRPSKKRRRSEAAALVLTALVSIAIHGAGAISLAAPVWNNVPVLIKEDPMRVFEWKRPQWLCAFFPEMLPPPDETERGRHVDED